MRMQVPLTKPQPWVLPVTVVCLALGALIALMLRLNAPTNEPADPNMRAEDQARFYKMENAKLEAQLTKLNAERNELLDSSTSQNKLQGALQKELDDLRIRVGMTVVEGPGIVVTLDDSNALKTVPTDIDANALIVHDYDLMLLVNELRSAGAEAIAINDQRVVGTTAIRCVGPVIQINNRPVSSPFTIRAIGKSDTLYGAVNLPRGELDQIRSLGTTRVDAAKQDKIRVPAVVVIPALEVGKPVKDAKGTDDGN